MTDDISGLRKLLFETARAVKAGELDVAKARAVNELGRTLIDSAKVEIDYLRLKEDGKSTFIALESDGGELPNGITGIVRHRLAG